MNSLLTRSARRAPVLRAPRSATFARAGLHWIHDGLRHRATLWPEIRFERETAPDEWTEGAFGSEVFASAALGASAAQWRDVLVFAAVPVREFLEHFEFGRMAALHVIARCPALFEELAEVPALTPFLAQHLSLRGGDAPAWGEISAVYEREGIFGVLQWLGLPASRQTLAILGQVAGPDLPCRLLEPLRAALWEPEAIWALSHTATLTDTRIAETCHALAA